MASDMASSSYTYRSWTVIKIPVLTVIRWYRDIHQDANGDDSDDGDDISTDSCSSVEPPRVPQSYASIVVSSGVSLVVCLVVNLVVSLFVSLLL